MTQQEQRILLIGGNGYIGSHTAYHLHTKGLKVGIMDNLSKSNATYLDHLQNLIPELYINIGDCLSMSALDTCFTAFKPTAIIHFAAFKSVPESVKNPLDYYEHNLMAVIQTLKAMNNHQVSTLIFSSSAAVYGVPETLPIEENSDCKPTNPYGKTKLFAEHIIEDTIKANGGSAIALRYFNPVGAMPDKGLGEISTQYGNVAPLIARAAINNTTFGITGTDFDTKDGSGERDYIHIQDLAQAHYAAYLYAQTHTGFDVFNIGTGTPYTVHDLVKAFKRASNKTIHIENRERREGDVASCWANPKKAEQKLQWKSEKTLEEMCADQWTWQTRQNDLP